MKTHIKVGLADDHLVVRQGLVALLMEFKNVCVVFDVSNGKELLEKLKTSKPDIILLDIDMPVMGGKAALEKIILLYPEIKVIMLSMFYNDEFIQEYIKMGAKSFLPKECDKEKLIEAIIAVHLYGHYYDKHLLEVLSNQEKKSNVLDTFSCVKIKLSERELKTLKLLRQNKTNKEIADEICISERTVEGLRSNLMKKTRSKNLAALLAYVLENNLLGQK